jgi:hypothetical protein
MNPADYDHTPGPWHYVTGAVWTTPGGPDDGGVCIATRASLNDRTRAEPILPTQKDANMRLCAVAPDLLAALRGLVAAAAPHFDADDYERDPAVIAARAAIAKVQS